MFLFRSFQNDKEGALPVYQKVIRLDFCEALES